MVCYTAFTAACCTWGLRLLSASTIYRMPPSLVMLTLDRIRFEQV